MSSSDSISSCISRQPVDVGVGRGAAGSRPAPAAPAARASGRPRRPRAWSAAAPGRPCSPRARSAPRPPGSAAPRAPAAGSRPKPLGDLLLPDPLAGRDARRTGSRRAGGRRPAAALVASAASGSRRPVLSGSGGRTPCRPGRTPARTACPTGEEVDPALALAGPLARRRLAEHGDAAARAVGDRGVEVVDVERDVVAADVAVARRRRRAGRARRTRTPRRSPGRRSGRSAARRMTARGWHVQVLGHPVAVVVRNGPSE